MGVEFSTCWVLTFVVRTGARKRCSHRTAQWSTGVKRRTCLVARPVASKAWVAPHIEGEPLGVFVAPFRMNNRLRKNVMRIVCTSTPNQVMIAAITLLKVKARLNRPIKKYWNHRIEDYSRKDQLLNRVTFWKCSIDRSNRLILQSVSIPSVDEFNMARNSLNRRISDEWV